MSTSNLFRPTELLGNKSPNPSAFNEWRDACKRFSSTAQYYFDACLRLGAVYIDTLHISNDVPLVAHSFDDELENIATYILQLRRAQAAIGLARNRSQKLAPVNHLPREVLSNIFRLLVMSEYHGLKSSKEIQPSLYPSLLSEVCTHWRRLVSSTPLLWSCLDLVASGRDEGRFYARATRFLEHSTSTPLYIRVHELGHSFSSEPERLYEWLAPIMNRTYSLECCQPVWSLVPSILYSILQCWLEHGNPGSAKVLNIHKERSVNQVIEPADSNPKPGVWQFNVSPQKFAEFFKSITSLRLSGIFPPWDSLSHCSVVHLSLKYGSITEAQLILVLSSNPQLRTLSFGLDVIETASRDACGMSVKLPNLEVLNLDSVDVDQLRLVLRLLALGPRPLRMSYMWRDDYENDLIQYLIDDKDIRGFFQQSNVAAVHFVEYLPEGEVTAWFPNTFNKLPYLHSLCLQGPRFLSAYLPTSNNLCQQLRELCLVDCQLDLNAFKQVLCVHSIQVLRLCGCRVYAHGEEYNEDAETEDLEGELSQLVPDVKCYELISPENSDPYLNWDYRFF